MNTSRTILAGLTLLGGAALTGCNAQPHTVADSSDTITMRRSTIVRNATVNAPAAAGMQLGAGDMLGQQLFTTYLVRLRDEQPELFANVDTASNMP